MARDPIDQLRRATRQMHKSLVQRRATTRRTPGGAIVPVRGASYEFHADGAFNLEDKRKFDKRQRNAPEPALGSEQPKQPERHMDSSVSDLTLQRHLKEIRGLETAIKRGTFTGHARDIAIHRLETMKATADRIRPDPKAPSTAKQDVETGDHTARDPLTHREPRAPKAQRPAVNVRQAPTPGGQIGLFGDFQEAVQRKVEIRTADPDPLKHAEPRKEPVTGTPRIPSIKRAARQAKGKAAVDPIQARESIATSEDATIRKPKRHKGAPLEVKGAAAGDSRVNLGREETAEEKARRHAGPKERPVLPKVMTEPDKQDARVRLPGEAMEENLARLEPARVAMVRAGEPKEPEDREKFVRERKAMEAQYIKTWTPTIRNQAKRSLHSLGVEAQVDEKGRPTGMYADFLQEALLVSLSTIRSHDPKTHKTDLRDLVAGNVQSHLFRHWRKIIGGTGMGGPKANADLTQLSKVVEALQQKHGRTPTDEEIAAGMSRTAAEVRKLKQTAVSLAYDYLDRKANPDTDEGESFGNTLHSTRPGPESLIEEWDMHHRLEGHMRDAVQGVSDSRARLAIAHELGYHDEAHKAAKQVIKDGHLDKLASDILRLQANHAKLMGGVKGAKPEDLHLPPEKVIAGLGRHDALAGKRDAQKVALVENLMLHGHDPHAMLTQGLDDSDRPEGGRIAREGMVRNKIAQRLGYDRSYGGKWVKQAMEEMAHHAGLQRFRDEDLEKSWSNEFDVEPAIRLYREVFGLDAGKLAPLMERVTIFKAPDTFAKAIDDCRNVLTVTLENGYSYQMVVEDLVGRSGDLIKGWGTDLEKQHPGGHWVTIHGVHVFIDQGGTIVAGPQAFVGKHADEMKGHLEQEHGVAKKKGGKLEVNPADTAHHNADHSHLEDAMRYAGKTHVLHHGGNTLRVTVQGKYHGTKDGSAKVGTEMSHGFDPRNSEVFPDARAALRHLGLETGGVISESANDVLDTVVHGIEHDPDIIKKEKERLDRRIAKKMATTGGDEAQAKATMKSKLTKKEREALKAREEAARFRPNPGASTDTHDVFSATSEDGVVHHIRVSKATRKIEQSPMLEQLLGHREIRTAEDLRSALAETNEEEQTVQLSNGRNTWLVRVRHDGTGDPVIVAGKMAGKRLHEIVGASGGIQHHAGPVEYNGRKLYAGWDSRQKRVTALGNWSLDRAFGHFGAETDEQKAEVQRLLEDADARALPPTARAKMAKNGKVRVALSHSADEMEAARHLNDLSLTSKAPTHADLDDLAHRLAHTPFGDMKKKYRDKALAELGADASTEDIRRHAMGQVRQEFDFTHNLGKLQEVAKTLGALKEAGIEPKALAKEGGGPQEHGFHADVSQLEQIAHHLGALQIDKDSHIALTEHRRNLQDEAERAQTIAEEKGLQYLPHNRSDTEDGHLPTTIRGAHGKSGDPVYLTRPQEQFIQRFAEGQGKLINALDVGNGKTLSSITAMEAHKKAQGDGGPKRTLVVVPGHNQRKAWDDDFKAFTQDGADGRKMVMSHGKDVHPDATYHTVTAGMLANPNSKVKTADGREIHVLQHLREQGFDSAILDEAHKYNGNTKAKGAQRKAIEALLHGKAHDGLGVDEHDAMKAVIAATGTPMQNHVSELHGLVDMLHPGALGSRKSFEARYVRRLAGGGVPILAEGKEDELGSVLGNFMHRSTPEDLRAEQRPPTPKIHTHEIQASTEHVTPWRLKKETVGTDADGNPRERVVTDEHGDPMVEHHEPIAISDMLERHERAIRASGADQILSGEGGGNARVGMAAMQDATRDLYAVKEPHVENLVRQILREEPHAKIGTFSETHEGQHMLKRVLGRVLGEHNGPEDEEFRQAHYQHALGNLEFSHDQEKAKHEAITSRASHQLRRLQAFKEMHAEALAAQSPKASKRLGDLIRNVEIRHGQLRAAGDGDGHYAAALKDAMEATKHAMGSRLGYRMASITHDADEHEQTRVQNELRTDGSLKGIVLSSKMASTGINAGHLTHVIDLDGSWNPQEMKQMYARAARLTGSVPQTEVHQVHVVPHENHSVEIEGKGHVAVRSMDERKSQAAKAKAGIADAISGAVRRNKPAGAMPIANVSREFGGKAPAGKAPPPAPVSPPPGPTGGGEPPKRMTAADLDTKIEEIGRRFDELGAKEKEGTLTPAEADELKQVEQSYLQHLQMYDEKGDEPAQSEAKPEQEPKVAEYRRSRRGMDDQEKAAADREEELYAKHKAGTLTPDEEHDLMQVGDWLEKQQVEREARKHSSSSVWKRRAQTEYDRIWHEDRKRQFSEEVLGRKYASLLVEWEQADTAEEKSRLAKAFIAEVLSHRRPAASQGV